MDRLPAEEAGTADGRTAATNATVRSVFIIGPDKKSKRSSGGKSVKWAGMFLFGFIILLGGVVAALWKLGVLARIGTTWTIIGLVIALGLGIMISVGSSGAKENIQIDRK
jgi:hypothetical protein